jgi:hypothetical protein
MFFEETEKKKNSFQKIQKEKRNGIFSSLENKRNKI